MELLEADRADQAAERKRSLLSTIAYLRARTSTCPNDKSRAEEMRAVTLWSDTDVLLLRSLAISFGTMAASLATEAAGHLAVLAERVREVRNTPEEKGVRWEVRLGRLVHRHSRCRDYDRTTPSGIFHAYDASFLKATTSATMPFGFA
jgi:hypothetical protein